MSVCFELGASVKSNRPAFPSIAFFRDDPALSYTNAEQSPNR